MTVRRRRCKEQPDEEWEKEIAAWGSQGGEAEKDRKRQA
jgi:hypothetical protein